MRNHKMTSGIKLMSKNKTANVTSSQKQVVAIIAMKYYHSSKSRAVVLLVVFVTTQAQLIPTEYISTPPLTSVNGSCSIGKCSTVSTPNEETLLCIDSASSALFDGQIPTLTGLDSHEWASQLFTMRKTESSAKVALDFIQTPNFVRVERIELIMFNCPQWGIGVQTIQVLDMEQTIIATDNPSITSCDSLVKICIPARSTSTMYIIRFSLSPDSDWVHLAELNFWGNGVDCPSPTTVAPSLDTNTSSTASSSSTSCSKENPYLNTSDPTTSHSNTNTNRSDSNTQTTPPSDSECVKVFCSILTTAVFLLTAVFATVICVLVVVIICKCHPKFKPKREARLVDAATSGGEEGGGVELPEHEYDIIGQVRCDRNINVKKNTAYTISSPLSVI